MFGCSHLGKFRSARWAWWDGSVVGSQVFRAANENARPVCYRVDAAVSVQVRNGSLRTRVCAGATHHRHGGNKQHRSSDYKKVPRYRQ